MSSSGRRGKRVHIANKHKQTHNDTNNSSTNTTTTTSSSPSSSNTSTALISKVPSLPLPKPSHTLWRDQPSSATTSARNTNTTNNNPASSDPSSWRWDMMLSLCNNDNYASSFTPAIQHSTFLPPLHNTTKTTTTTTTQVMHTTTTTTTTTSNNSFDPQQLYVPFRATGDDTTLLSYGGASSPRYTHHILPALMMSERDELKQLNDAFEHFITQLHKRTVPPLSLQSSSLPHFLSVLSEEKAIYDLFFSELIRQVTIQCRERGALLDKIREAYRHMLERVPLYLLGVQEEMSGYQHLVKQLQEECETLRETQFQIKVELGAYTHRFKEAAHELEAHRDMLSRAEHEKDRARLMFTQFKNEWDHQRALLEQENHALREEKEEYAAMQAATITAYKQTRKHNPLAQELIISEEFPPANKPNMFSSYTSGGSSTSDLPAAIASEGGESEQEFVHPDTLRAAMLAERLAHLESARLADIAKKQQQAFSPKPVPVLVSPSPAASPTHSPTEAELTPQSKDSDNDKSASNDKLSPTNVTILPPPSSSPARSRAHRSLNPTPQPSPTPQPQQWGDEDEYIRKQMEADEKAHEQALQAKRMLMTQSKSPISPVEYERILLGLLHSLPNLSRSEIVAELRAGPGDSSPKHNLSLLLDCLERADFYVLHPEKHAEIRAAIPSTWHHHVKEALIEKDKLSLYNSIMIASSSSTSNASNSAVNTKKSASHDPEMDTSQLLSSLQALQQHHDGEEGEKQRAQQIKDEPISPILKMKNKIAREERQRKKDQEKKDSKSGSPATLKRQLSHNRSNSSILSRAQSDADRHQAQQKKFAKKFSKHPHKSPSASVGHSSASSTSTSLRSSRITSRRNSHSQDDDVIASKLHSPTSEHHASSHVTKSASRASIADHDSQNKLFKQLADLHEKQSLETKQDTSNNDDSKEKAQQDKQVPEPLKPSEEASKSKETAKANEPVSEVKVDGASTLPKSPDKPIIQTSEIVIQTEDIEKDISAVQSVVPSVVQSQSVSPTHSPSSRSPPPTLPSPQNTLTIPQSDFPTHLISYSSFNHDEQPSHHRRLSTPQTISLSHVENHLDSEMREEVIESIGTIGVDSDDEEEQKKANFLIPQTNIRSLSQNSSRSSLTASNHPPRPRSQASQAAGKPHHVRKFSQRLPNKAASTVNNDVSSSVNPSPTLSASSSAAQVPTSIQVDGVDSDSYILLMDTPTPEPPRHSRYNSISHPATHGSALHIRSHSVKIPHPQLPKQLPDHHITPLETEVFVPAPHTHSSSNNHSTAPRSFYIASQVVPVSKMVIPARHPQRETARERELQNIINELIEQNELLHAQRQALQQLHEQQSVSTTHTPKNIAAAAAPIHVPFQPAGSIDPSISQTNLLQKVNEFLTAYRHSRHRSAASIPDIQNQVERNVVNGNQLMTSRFVTLLQTGNVPYESQQELKKRTDAFTTHVSNTGATAPLPLGALIKWIRGVYDSKMTADELARTESRTIFKLPEFVYEMQRQKYGLLKIIHMKTWQILHALEHWRHSCSEVDSFASFLEESRCLDELIIFLRCRAVIMSCAHGFYYGGELESKHDNMLITVPDVEEYVSLDRVRAIISTIFANKTSLREKIYSSCSEASLLWCDLPKPISNDKWKQLLPRDKCIDERAINLTTLLHILLAEFRGLELEYKHHQWASALFNSVMSRADSALQPAASTQPAQSHDKMNFQQFQQVFSLAEPKYTEREIAQLYTSVTRNAGTTTLSRSVFEHLIHELMSSGRVFPLVEQSAYEQIGMVRLVARHYTHLKPFIAAEINRLQHSENERDEKTAITLRHIQTMVEVEVGEAQDARRLVTLYRGLLTTILSHQSSFSLNEINTPLTFLHEELKSLSSVILQRHRLLAHLLNSGEKPNNSSQSLMKIDTMPLEIMESIQHLEHEKIYSTNTQRDDSRASSQRMKEEKQHERKSFTQVGNSALSSQFNSDSDEEVISNSSRYSSRPDSQINFY